MPSATMALAEDIRQALQTVELERVQHLYWEQNECVVLESLLLYEVLAHHFLPEVERLRGDVHRNYILRHKKGGSVSYYALVEKAPALLTLYRHPTVIDCLSRPVGAPVMPCPDDDLHACALYFYPEPGDHIGYHYDTSYYHGCDNSSADTSGGRQIRLGRRSQNRLPPFGRGV